MKLRYDIPAQPGSDLQLPRQIQRYFTDYLDTAMEWDEALPLGNGKLGAMVFGFVAEEKIMLNEGSLWWGGPRDRNNPDARAALPEVRRLLFAGKAREAQSLASLSMAGTPPTQRVFEPLGTLKIKFRGHEAPYAAYARELDLETATARVCYAIGRIHYQREMFASAPDGVIVIRVSADVPGAISLETTLERGRYFDGIRVVDGRTILLHGRCGGEKGMRFRSGLSAVATGGTVRTMGNWIVVENADEVVLLVSAATSFTSRNPDASTLRNLRRAKEKGFTRLRADHLEDYQELFNRVSLKLEGPGNEDLTTKSRLAAVKAGGSDPGLEALYFQFGRYLMISASRPGGLPIALLGIWNQNWLPAWDGKYTININVQMNYWPAEVCALPECHQPLFELLQRMRKTGRRTARVMYGCRGFTAHHNTDIWADTAPQDVYLPASTWPMGAAWLSLHLWEHFAYGGDLEFLRHAYPIMREAAEFLLDFLVEDPQGRLVTCPSVSPENSYLLADGTKASLCAGPTMDNQITDALFRHCIEAAEILKRDSKLKARLADASARLPRTAIGGNGQIREWLEDYAEAEPGHRHISQLFALHPDDAIDPVKTPELARAARTTIERRLANGGGHTGWSRAWIMNFCARLGDGEMAHESLLTMLRHFTLPNLFNLHPPFCVDGNFGATAGMAEMLLQSQVGELRLLPALPAHWADGAVKGLRARGGFIVDIKWNEGRLTECAIQSTRAGQCRLRYTEKLDVRSEQGRLTLTPSADGAWVFTAVAGCVYQVTIAP